MLRDSQRLLPVRVFATLYFLSLFWAVLFLLIKKKNSWLRDSSELRRHRPRPPPAWPSLLTASFPLVLSAAWGSVSLTQSPVVLFLITPERTKSTASIASKRPGWVTDLEAKLIAIKDHGGGDQ